MDEIVASIHEVQLSEKGRYVVIVRLLEGTITPGTSLTTVRSPDGEERPADLRVAKIWRYETETDLIDPPHAGKLELQGGAGLSLDRGVLLVRSVQDLTRTPQEVGRALSRSIERLAAAVQEFAFGGDRHWHRERSNIEAIAGISSVEPKGMMLTQPAFLKRYESIAVGAQFLVNLA